MFINQPCFFPFTLFLLCASFSLGSDFRTGLITVGRPGVEEGIPDIASTLAQMLNDHGETTGQFGKNQLGDRDEQVSTNHRFDQFLGIFDHLNAGEHLGQNDFHKDEGVLERFNLDQRGIIHSKVLPDGTYRIKDLGPWGCERQRTLYQDVLVESKRFIKDATEAKQPFFVWRNTMDTTARITMQNVVLQAGFLNCSRSMRSDSCCALAAHPPTIAFCSL